MIKDYLIKRKTKIQPLELSYVHKRVPFWKPFLYILPSIAIITMFTLLPFFMSLQKAFNPEVGGETDFAESFGLESFHRVTSDANFNIGLRNSLLYAFTSLPITFLISLLISSAIAHIYRKYARGFWQTLFFLPYVTNSVAVIAAFTYFFDSQFGIANLIAGKRLWLDSGDPESLNPFVVILTNGIWGGLAFQIILLTTAMLSVDKTLYKAASIDGASRVKQFFRITLPSIKGTMNLIITLAIIGGIKVFPLALFTNDVSKASLNGGMTLMLYIYSLIKKGSYSEAGAATIILFLIGVSFSIFMKGSIRITIVLSNKWGERRVYNKVKNTKIY